VVVAATGELTERERNSAATFSLDRLLDLVGADGQLSRSPQVPASSWSFGFRACQDRAP
jgi:hypothetical protein